MGEELSIGRFARLSGLSIGALRHYDQLDLLRPAAVDATTGYRRYRVEQLDQARRIARLRDLEMPLDEIRAALAEDDPADRRRHIREHRARIEARTYRLQRVAHSLRHLESDKEPIVPEPTLPTEIDPATRRRLAADLFNHVWKLLETPDRTAEQDDEMLHAAHASRFHWGEVGEPGRLHVGEWQCSRVYAVLGRGEPALWHARRCVAICQREGIGDWGLAAAYEAMARASAVAGDRAAADAWKTRAIAAVAEIGDAEEREVIEGDIATLP